MGIEENPDSAWKIDLGSDPALIYVFQRTSAKKTNVALSKQGSVATRLPMLVGIDPVFASRDGTNRSVQKTVRKIDSSAICSQRKQTPRIHVTYRQHPESREPV
jgi:hypothetical protein